MRPKSRILFYGGILTCIVGMWLVLGGTAQAAERNALETPKDDSSCCVRVGDLDSDTLVTMGDLTIMIDCVFRTPWPGFYCCVCGECNLDASMDCFVTMGDLTVMIDHLFISLSPLPTCDQLLPQCTRRQPW